MARVRLDLTGLARQLRPEMQARARRALQLYRREPLKRDAAGYPFAQREADGSIRDPGRSSVRPIARGVRVSVRSRGAPFIEGGNDARGSTIRGNLAIPLRGSGARGKRRFSEGRVVVGSDGNAYLMVQRVRSYRGRHLLEKSVRTAFGLGPRQGL